MGSQARRRGGPSFADARRCGPFLLLGIVLVVSCRLHTDTPSYPSRLVDSVSVIDAPLFDVKVLPSGKFVYVTNDYAGALSVLRTSDMQLVAQIPFNGGWSSSGQVVCSPDGQYVYATCYTDDDGVAVVRTADQVVVDSFMVDGEVTSVAIAPDGKRLYMAVDADSGFIVVARLPDDVVEDTIFPAGMDIYISSLQVAPDGSRLFVGNYENVFAMELSDNTVVWKTQTWVSPAPGGIVLHPTGSSLYVADQQECVLVLEAGTGAISDSVLLPPNVWNMDVAPDGSFLYVACGDETLGGLAVVRTSDDSLVSVTAMPDEVYDAAPSPDGRRLYVACENGKLYVLSR